MMLFLCIDRVFLQPATMRFELEDTFINTLNRLNLRWMRDRIKRMWPQWVDAAKEFAAEGSLRRQHQAKKVEQLRLNKSNTVWYTRPQLLRGFSMIFFSTKANTKEL